MRRLLLLLLLVFVASPAHAEWWEARTEHFIIYSQDGERRTRDFATELEQYDHALRSLQSAKFEPITSDSQRVTIFRTGDIDYMSRLAHGPAAGFYIPQLNPVAFTPVREGIETGSRERTDSRTDLDPRSVLFHEYAHHFMFQYFPAGYPSWYVEAFAETVATIVLKDDGSFHVGNPPQYRSDALFHGMLTVTPQSLLASTAKPDMEDFFGYYTVGWLMNHYLTFEPSRKGQLKTYLRLVNSGVPSPDAARQAFGDLDKLGGEIARYKHAGRLLGADVRPGTKANPQVAMRKLDADEEAAMRVKIRSKAGVTRSEARDVVADARGLVGKYPNSYAANLALAEAEFDVDDLAAAQAAAARAAQLRPESVEALTWEGKILVERGRKDKQYLAAARPLLARAHDIDLYDPSPLFYNYLSYFYSGAPIPEPALIGLEHAYERARQDSDLRLVLARQLLSEKKGQLARSILLPLSLNPHESKAQKTMHGIIELIDAKKVDAAYAQLVKEMAKAEEEKKKGS